MGELQQFQGERSWAIIVWGYRCVTAAVTPSACSWIIFHQFTQWAGRERGVMGILYCLARGWFQCEELKHFKRAVIALEIWRRQPEPRFKTEIIKLGAPFLIWAQLSKKIQHIICVFIQRIFLPNLEKAECYVFLFDNRLVYPCITRGRHF